MHRRISALLPVLMTLFVCAPSFAQVASHTIARRLLGDLWNKEGSNRHQSTSEFEQAQQSGAANANVIQSYVLNQMRHSQHREALRAAELLAAAAPTDFDAWILKSWLDAVTDQYDRTMVDLQQLKKAMSSANELDDATRERCYEHLGLVIGYLQGPAGARPNQRMLSTTIAKIADGADEASLAIFNEKRESVLDQYERLGDEHAIAAEEFVEQNKMETESQIQTLTSTNQSIDQRAEQISPEIARLSAEAAERIADVRTRMAPVEQAITAASQTINSAQLALQQILQEILFQEQILMQTRDRFLRWSIINQINNLRVSAAAADADLISARNEMYSAQNQYAALANEQASIRQSYDAQIGELRAEQMDLDRQKRKNLAKVDKLVTGPVKITGKAALIKNDIEAFTTFVPYPLEEHRQQILDRLPIK